MHWVFLVVYLVVAFTIFYSVSVSSVDSLPDKNEISTCLHKIICDDKITKPFTDIIDNLGPDGVAKLIRIGEDILQLETDATPGSLEYWSAVMDLECTFNEQTRADNFGKLVLQWLEWSGDVCERNREGDECKKVEKGTKDFQSLLKEFYKDGTCGGAGAMKNAFG